MDPNATFDLIVEAMLAQDYEEAGEHARNLWNWLCRGGAKPDRTAHQLRSTWAPGALKAPGLKHLIDGICRFQG
jgi:hypothetical protein